MCRAMPLNGNERDCARYFINNISWMFFLVG